MGEMQPIFVDVYPGDLDGRPNWTAAAADPSINGAILKVSQGRTPSASGWLSANWKAVAEVNRNVGNDWFRGAYHYLMCADDPNQQADLFLSTLAAAGGLEATDLWPIVDVERADNMTATAQQFIDATSAFVARIKQQTDRDVMLYSGSALRDLGITSRMGCRWFWTARYTPTLPQEEIAAMGWDEASLWGWQYQGTGLDNIGRLDGYPTSIAGFATDAAVDLTVMVMKGGLAALPGAL